MRVFFGEQRGVSTLFLSRFFLNKSLHFKLLITVLPSVVALFIITGIATYYISNRYLSIALHRTVRLQAIAQARALEDQLEDARRDLLLFSQNMPNAQEMERYIEKLALLKNAQYCEFIFISQRDKEHVCAIKGDVGVRILSKELCADIRPNPLLLYQDIKDLAKNEVWVAKITYTELPYPTVENINNKILRHIIRFVTPVFDKNNDKIGYYCLGLDARALRNTLSKYNSPKSPLYAFARAAELRYSYVFDIDGWILFQSEKEGTSNQDLSASFASSGYTGTLGRTWQPQGFLPGATWNGYWKMVSDVAEGKQDLIKVTDDDSKGMLTLDQSLAYAPIHFQFNPNSTPIVYAGLAFIDTSRLTLVAGYKLIDVFSTVLLVSLVATTLLVLAASRFSSQPIKELTQSVLNVQNSGKLEEIEMPSMSGYEASSLTEAINIMICTMRNQLSEIQAKDNEIKTVHLKERVSLDEALQSNWDEEKTDLIPEIVGGGPIIEKWKSDILKAAQADVDVLIFGETGTGKQLAAEAVHNRSKRAAMPFVSINCGALDENLLLDTLFGHMKGAYTEAKNERKGAFLEAHGGTLFLDEIQAASLRVQQALLRAIAMRKIKPLGSDKEFDVDVRLLAATNVDLSLLIPQKAFREDLYFRLKVVTVHTPPLRLHKENISKLAKHFLEEAMILASKHNLAFSKGGLQKLTSYNWPGNVRELKNAITRAVVMAENSVIQAEELLLESDLNGEIVRSTNYTNHERENIPLQPYQDGKESKQWENIKDDGILNQNSSVTSLNKRQKLGYEHVVKVGSINRNTYQETVGGDLPSRTAIYDLQDMVKKGLLTKEGKGPSTKYVLSSGNMKKEKE